MAQQTYVNRLLGLFNLGSQTDGIGPKDAKGKKGLIIGSSVTGTQTNLQQIWSWYLRETYDTSSSLKNRDIRYKDLEFMVQNDPIVQMAADLYADEAVQGVDGGGKPVRVKAKSEVQTYIEGLLTEWGYTQPVCRELIYNKVLYGDSFDSNKVTEKDGIVSVTPLSVWAIKDRLEFDPSKTLQGINNLSGMSSGTKIQKLARLKTDLEDSATDPTSVFQKYLFGFELQNGIVVPPWAISHYRCFSLQDEFAPWGRSRFINTLTAFRQLMASKTLMQVARAASFPRDLYEVQTDPGMTSTEKWDACEEFQEQLDNTGVTSGEKEMASIGQRLILPKDLAAYTQLTNTIDPSSIADVEFLQDAEIISTFIPKGYLITDKASFGVSGQSLLQQFKPFGRRVFSDQSDFLRELVFKIKTHLAIINKFNGFDTLFELSMEFPVLEESSDRLQRKSDELDLAQKALTVIKDTLGVEKVPADIVKEAFRDLSFLPPTTVDTWVDKMVKEQEENGSAPSENSFYERAHNRYDVKTKDSLTEKLLGLKAAKQFHEGVSQQKHYYSSCNTTTTELRNRFLTEALLEGDKKVLRESFKRPLFSDK